MRSALALLVLLVGCDAHRPTPWPAQGGGSPAPSSPAAPERSSGCAKKDPASGVVEQRFQSAGRARTATIVAPMNLGPAFPVVFVLHGDGGTGAQIRKSFPLEEQANGKAIFVYPDGMVDLDTPTTKNPDVDVFDSLYAYVQAQWCVDLHRVFVTGFSKGAYMANQLACKRGDKIRAIASHSGGGPYEANGSYDDQGNLVCNGKPVASLVIHGLADGVVQPSEGQNSVKHWAQANVCGAAQKTRGACVEKQGCNQPVVDCKVPGLGHALWPQAAPTIWAFFDAQK